jgi:hypothetical protein
MNELRSVRRLRPEVEPWDDSRSERIWAEITGMPAASSPPAEPAELEPALVFSLSAGPERSRRPLLAVAAAAVAVIGLGAVVGVRSLGNTADQPAPAAQPTASPPEVDSEPAATDAPSTPFEDDVVMVLPEMPDGLKVLSVTPPSTRREESVTQRLLYGAADDPGDPARMIAIEFDPNGLAPIPCHSFTSMPDPAGRADDIDPAAWQSAATPVDSSTSFTAPSDGTESLTPGVTGAACVGANGLAQAGWFASGAAIGLTGGDAVGTEFLVDLAHSIHVTDIDTIEVTTTSLTYDLMPLVTHDVAYINEITETAWIASDATMSEVEREQAAAEGRPVDEPGELAVRTWYGGGDAALYAIATPIGAERITVRGQPGYRYTGPGEVEVWWAETDDLVVRVRSSNLYDADALMALIDQLQPADSSDLTPATTRSD